RENGIPVSLCGDMASDPAHIGALLKAGLRSLSVAPAGLARVKATIADIRVGAGQMAPLEPRLDEQGAQAVALYKRLLADVIDGRPSGTRQRLAAALGKNRSFI